MLYSNFGYEVHLLCKSHLEEIYSLLSSHLLDRNRRSPEMYAKDKRVLVGNINFALGQFRYNSVGLFKNGTLVGISFSSVSDRNTPWLGWFYIDKAKQKSKASVVLINYVVNHLYKDFTIEIGYTDTTQYKNQIKVLPAPIPFGIFKEDFPKRLLRICKEG